MVLAVHAAGNGDKANSMLLKQDFRIKPSLQVVPPDTALVLGDHTADLSSLNVRHKLFFQPGRSKDEVR